MIHNLNDDSHAWKRVGSSELIVGLRSNLKRDFVVSLRSSRFNNSQTASKSFMSALPAL